LHALASVTGARIAVKACAQYLMEISSKAALARALARESRRAPRAKCLQNSGERGKQCIDGSVVAKRFADVRETVDVAGSEDKTAAELKRIPPRFVLTMAGGPSARSRGGVVAAKQMQQVRGFQSRGSISQPLFVDQQRKGDPRFLAEEPRVLAVPQSDGGQPGSLFLEFFLVLAQLRDVLTTEDSAVVP
jgi:hypothetical protein